MKTERKIAGSALEALKWIVENEHHEGMIVQHPKKGLVLKGSKKSLLIPQGMTAGLFDPSNYDVTKRLYEPSKAGQQILDKEEKN